MRTTYAVFLLDGQGRRDFRPLLCETTQELLRMARTLLAEHPTAATLEAWFGDELVLTLARGEA